MEHLVHNYRSENKYCHGSPHDTQTEICIDTDKKRVYLCSGSLPTPNYMVISGEHMSQRPIVPDLPLDLKCKVCNTWPASVNNNDKGQSCRRLPCE
eukprot:9138959-Karenia_brevis.AAC.1